MVTKVIELEWYNTPLSSYICRAKTPFGTYGIEQSRWHGNGYWVYLNGSMLYSYATLELACEGAQLDFGTRVKECLINE